MSQTEQIMIVLDSDLYKDNDFSQLSKTQKLAAIAAATGRVDDNVRKWFEANGHSCFTRALEAIGSIFIFCQPDSAAAFEQAVLDGKVPGVTSVLRNAQDVTFDLAGHAKKSGHWKGRVSP